MAYIFTPIMIIFGAMGIIKYCIVACVRSFFQRLIKTALTKRTLISYQNNIFILYTAEQESQLILDRFEEKNC
jgi:hypothetical protein